MKSPAPHRGPCACLHGRGHVSTLLVLLLSALVCMAPDLLGNTEVREMDLDACIDTALQNNRRRPSSRFAVAIAEAQHRQVLSSYWPQVQLKAAFQRLDEAPDFIFPASTMGVPPQTVTVPANTALITVPAGVLGPNALQLPVSVPEQSITTSGQLFPVPEQRIKLMDPASTVGALDLTWLLFDGGMRRGLRTQAQALVEAMKQEQRRTDLEITDSVKRLYYGAVLARQLRKLGTDTLARMEATLQLTETLYKGNGGKVTKTDFLDNKVMVETLRSVLASLEKNEAMAQAALANTLGMPWQASVAPKSTEIPFEAPADSLEQLVGSAYEFSPDWRRIEAGLRACEGAVQTARSGHAPKLALTGNLHKWWNSHEAGLASAGNKQGWTLGIGLELPIFNGFLTREKIAEARARLDQLKEQRLLLREGLGLQIKDLVLGIEAAGKTCRFSLEARKAAEENRDLNTRAYQSELVETEKVIRAQLVEAFMVAQHYKARYDHVAMQSQLAMLVGSELARRLNAAP